MPLSLTLGDRVYRLDADDRCYDWATDVPLCPACGLPLTSCCDEDGHAAVDPLGGGQYRIDCDGCGWKSAVLS